MHVGWNLRGECTCVGEVWKFVQFHVKLDVNADIWRNMSPANDAWARRAKGDHVKDYFAWADTDG